MKKAIIAILLGILFIGASGAMVVSAVASDNAGANYGFGSMHRWSARYTDSGSRYGNFSHCLYLNSNNTSELKVKTVDEALEIARTEINSNVSKEDISQMRRWWIVSYQDEEGVYKQARIDAENKISSIASNLNVVFEQYPDLKANQNCIQLQEEIVNTENKLAYAKQSYNDSIENYNANKKSFFTSMIVNMFKSKLDFDFPYWQLSEAKVAEQENYTVKL